MFGYSTAPLISPSATGGVWIKLYNTTLSSSDTPATTGEVGTTAAADDYTPQWVASSSNQWEVPTTADPAVTKNTSEIVFTASATTGWGLVKSVMIASSSAVGGIMFWWGDLSTEQTISSGNTVKFSTAALQITET
jgi:hypothetical protein